MAEVIINGIGNGMPLPMNIVRQNPVPLDSSSVFYPSYYENGERNYSALENATLYAQSNPVAYVGQIVSVCEGDYNEEGVFVIDEENPNSGVYYIADRDGKLIKLVNNTTFDEFHEEQLEDIEVDYSKIIKIINNDVFEGAIILASRPYNEGTSDLFINGIKYNNTEYTEVYYDETKVGEGLDKVDDDSVNGMFNAVFFDAFEVIPPTQNSEGVYNDDGDEITLMADYEQIKI